MANNYCVIQDGKVANIIFSDEGFNAKYKAENPDISDIVLATGNVGIGWGYENGEFIDPNPVE